ncbi:MAG TPA: RyR domain-containing protein [Candidatus Omnitrophota bacterium]|nr:RyR domain-containing protein [Candidatus Omnitrophota bacterium]
MANRVRRFRPNRVTFVTKGAIAPIPSKSEPAMKIIDIARVCHDVNRAYCAAIGDTSQPAWDDAPDWQKQSAIAGVEFTLANPDVGPSASHESWMAEKERDGWKFGPVKDPEKKEHPCFVPYDELPGEQKAKDYLFQGVVRALAPMLTKG